MCDFWFLFFFCSSLSFWIFLVWILDVLVFVQSWWRFSGPRAVVWLLSLFSLIFWLFCCLISGHSCHILLTEPKSWKPCGGIQLVLKPVCRDSSEINHCLLLIYFGKRWFKPYTVWDQLFMSTGSVMESSFRSNSAILSLEDITSAIYSLEDIKLCNIVLGGHHSAILSLEDIKLCNIVPGGHQTLQ